MRKTLGGIGCALLLAASACGSVATNPDAGQSDAGPTIDGAVPADANLTPDAMPPIMGGPPSTELTGGGAKLTGTTYSMDVQVAHPFSQLKASGGGKTVEGAAAIKP